ncbi:hypothetical protein AURDEDRAFT_130834 [Auricularia subglabra TFB-10046 SS5]|uniref:Uncharacterized protein n=1 Tax=Auricularia subglabra (strain TFB-10046 / SS5) TaxID=717982 RepID=J0WQZ1_AURST|nr:hypothetical protein AURDEDRAFT_130834 [Auricularia subglabra TFB-10046 SS5]
MCLFLEDATGGRRVGVTWPLINNPKLTTAFSGRLDTVVELNVPIGLVISIIEDGLAAPALTKLVIQFNNENTVTFPELSLQEDANKLDVPMLREVHIVAVPDQQGEMWEGFETVSYIFSEYGLRAAILRMKLGEQRRLRRIHLEGVHRITQAGSLPTEIARFELEGLAEEITSDDQESSGDLIVAGEATRDGDGN